MKKRMYSKRVLVALTTASMIAGSLSMTALAAADNGFSEEEITESEDLWTDVYDMELLPDIHIEDTAEGFAEGSASEDIADASALTSSEIKSIALKAAGLTGKKVKNYYIEKDYDNGTLEYEVHFTYSSRKYDVEINAYTGTVNSFSKDLISPVPTSSQKVITESKAKSKALSKAGLTGKKVSYRKCILEWDDGIYKYDIEFTYGKKKYEVELRASNGNLVNYDWELILKDYSNKGSGNAQGNTGNSGNTGNTGNSGNTGNNNNQGNSGSQGTTAITLDQAKAKALGHAGLTGKNVRWTSLGTDMEHGRLVYELEFDYNFWEYDYEIDAYTGEILKAEKEYDD